jgi:hypothetical protein
MKPTTFDPLNHSGLLSLYEIESRAAEDVLAAERESAKNKITIWVRVIPVEDVPRRETDKNS